jgi:large subunit ribosomal protein L25
MLLKVNNREVTGRKVKNLRNSGLVPASIYGPEIKAFNVSIDSKEFKKVFKEAGYSTLIDLDVEGSKKVKALVKEVQYDPVAEKFVHVSLYQVNMNKEISAEVPIHIKGEAPAVKNNIGLLVTPVSTIYVTCLPANLPSHLEIDVSNLNEIGDSIQISDIKLPEGVELDTDEAPETVLANISAPQKSIEQEEAEAAAAAEAAALAAGETAEGEEGAEGEAPAEGAEPKPAEGAAPEAKPEEKK